MEPTENVCNGKMEISENQEFKTVKRSFKIIRIYEKRVVTNFLINCCKIMLTCYGKNYGQQQSALSLNDIIGNDKVSTIVNILDFLSIQNFIYCAVQS